MGVRGSVLVGTVTAVIFSHAATSPAFAACDTNNSVFDDDFEFMDPSWGAPDDKFYVKDGVLVIKTWRSQVNFSTRNEGAANVCADVTITDAPDVASSPAGLIFWWQDWDNYYYVYYWADGNVEVRRVLKGKSNTIFTTQPPGIKKGVGQTNNIELRIKPKDATLLINGTEVNRFKGMQPKGGGVFGVTATSSQEKPATFTFDNFVVSATAE